MGIKGTLFAMPPQRRLETMKVGEKGYIEAMNIIVTREAIFIDRFSEVLTPEEYEDENEGYDGICVAVKRMGPNYTQDDFEIDVDILDCYDFHLETNAVLLENKFQEEQFVIFEKPHFTLEIIEKIRTKPDEKPPTEESLNSQLQKAVENEDFEAAEQLKRAIEDLKKK